MLNLKGGFCTGSKPTYCTKKRGMISDGGQVLKLFERGNEGAERRIGK